MNDFLKYISYLETNGLTLDKNGNEVSKEELNKPQGPVLTLNKDDDKDE